jgi:hypothetical protein
VLFTSNDVHFATVQSVLLAFASATAKARRGTPLLELRVIQPPEYPTAPGPIIRVRTRGTSVSGKLDRELIQSTVRANYERLRECYDAGLEKTPGLKGRLSVRFVIARDGSVPSVQLAESELPEAVSQCVLTEFQRLIFPRPEGGIVTVLYPIVFQPE